MSRVGEISQALEVRDSGPEGMIEQYRADFAKVLPAHVKPDTWVRLAQGVLRRNKDLMESAQRNPGSLMVALLESARLGHEPGTSAFYLVPFGGEVQGIEGYQGKIERIFRAGAVVSVRADVVQANDHFVFRPTSEEPPEHVLCEDADPGPIVKVYAYARMRTGGISRVVMLTRKQVEEEHRAHAKGWQSPKSPWKTQERQMFLKSAVHELCKWVPTSTEYRSSTGAVMDAEASRDGHAPVDAEIID